DDMQLRSVRMETAAEVARATTSMLGLDELLPRSVELIRDRFHYYYVGIFLMDDANAWAVLRAGTGDPGRRMLANEHKLHRESDSMIGLCVKSAAPQIALDVVEETIRFVNPLLPNTRSEMALPLVSRGVVIGAMTIQSDEVSAFTRDDITTLQTMADQLANAIQNARLYATSQDSIHELQRLQQNFALDSWRDYVGEKDIIGFNYDLNQVSPLMPFDQLDTNEFLEDTGMMMNRGVEGGDGAILRHSLNIRGKPVGMMSFEEPAMVVEWSEDQVVVLDAVRTQLELALENRLLIDRSQHALQEAQQRESELEFLQEISALLNATNDIADSCGDLMTRIRVFTPINQLTMVTYDGQTDTLTLLAGQGKVMGVYKALSYSATFNASGFGWVVQSSAVVIEDDIRITPRFLEDTPLAVQGVLARILLPLKLGARTMGILELGSAQVGAFSRPGVLPILQQVGAQAASAMERGNLLSVAQSNAEESQTLYEITRQLAEATDAPEILRAIYAHAFPDINALAEIGVFVTDPETGVAQSWLETVASFDNRDALNPLQPGFRVRVSEVPELKLLGTQHQFVCEDIRNDERIDDGMQLAFAEQNIRSFIVMELATGVAASERIGLFLIKFSNPYSPSDQDIRLYTTIADQAAVVLSNRQLFQEAESRVQRQSTAVDLANLTTALSDRNSLLNESVSFIQRRFGLHFAGIFMLDELGQWAVLQAGTGEIGDRLLLMGYRSQVDGQSLIAQCVREGRRIIALDVEAEMALNENPLLPETRSMLVFPLVSRGQTNG
ncbi:MAG: GAF domain-containing protein, partial [Anaerolineales bacterium]